MLAEYLLTGGTKQTEEDLMKIYETNDLNKIEILQKSQFNELPKMYSLYTEVELALEDVAQNMHDYGIHINKEKLQFLEKDYSQKRETLAKSLAESLGSINLNSPKQLGQALVLELGISLPKTKTGQFTTTSEALSVYEKEHKVVRLLLEFRAIDKVINTYICPILQRVDEVCRIHPKYDQMSAATGRLASSDPNIQSTPVIGVYGEAIRSVFSAPKGSKLISFDYSQQELRILAHLSGDKKLHEAFANNSDVHTLTASSVLGIPLEKIGKAERSIGKTLNFGIIYGETAYGLVRQLGKTPSECAGILARYFETYSGVKKYFDNLLIHAKIHGYIETLLGRRRGIPGLNLYTPKKFLLASEERILKNFPIQGSAADMTKMAMCAIWEKVLPKYPQAHIVMQIHDELVFEYEVQQKYDKVINTKNTTKGKTEEEGELIKKFIEEVRETMVATLPLSVPVVVDWKVGENWAEVK